MVPGFAPIGRGKLTNAERDYHLYTGGKFVHSISAATVSPEMDRIAIACRDGLRILDSQSGRVSITLPTRAEQLTAVSWNPRGKWLLTGDRDGEILLWDTGNWTSMNSKSTSNAPIDEIAWNPDGHSYAILHLNREGIELASLEGFGGGTYMGPAWLPTEGAATSLSWDRQGTAIIASSNADLTYIWRWNLRRPGRTWSTNRGSFLECGRESCREIEWPSRRVLSEAKLPKALMQNNRGAPECSSPECFSARITHHSWCPSGKSWAVRSSNGMIAISNREVLRSITGPESLAGYSWHLDWTTDCTEIFLSDNSGVQYRWNAMTGKPLSTGTPGTKSPSPDLFFPAPLAGLTLSRDWKTACGMIPQNISPKRWTELFPYFPIYRPTCPESILGSKPPTTKN